MVIGSISLGKYPVTANSSYEYYRTEGGEIIGGVQIIKITGSIVIDDDETAIPGKIVMSRLSDIVNLGKSASCIYVNIPGHYTGKAKIENVTTSPGSDPAWINRGEFGIDIKAPLQTIPANSFGITASDSVVEINRSSKVELSDDSHAYIYDGNFHRTFANASIELTVRCEPICQPNFSLAKVIKKLIKTGLHRQLSKFNQWSAFAKGRTVQITSNNTASITTQYVITPYSKASALTELKFDHNRTYGDNPSTKLIISGTITGLIDISVFDSDYGFNNTCSTSRLSNAEGVLKEVKKRFINIKSWDGTYLDLNILKNPPPKDAEVIQSDCIKPYLSTIGKARTEGVIDFSFEWSTDPSNDCGSDSNRITKDITVDLIEPQPQFIEHIIPDGPFFPGGTLIQDLNAYNARRVNVQYTINYPQNLCGSIPPDCENPKDIQDILDKYQINGILIKHTRSINNRSIVIDQSYIEC